MKIVNVETILTHAGLRNYLFLLVHTDTGLTGVGESSLEWQERAVEAIIHDWLIDRVIGLDPNDIDTTVNRLIRDQYQGGPTVLSAISGFEVALWDLLAKACGEPVYKLLGGRAHERLPAYANGWYGGACTPDDFADKARHVVDRGYSAMKFDPFGTAWMEMTDAEIDRTVETVAAVRAAVGEQIELMIEVHGRLSGQCAVAVGRRLAPYRPAWYEEPVTPNDLDLLKSVTQSLPFPTAAGERLYTLEDFHRLTSLRACSVVQMDPAHCGGLSVARKIATMAQANDMGVSPHCSIGPVALAAAIHLDWATPNAFVQEDFGGFDVPWRSELVGGWNPCTNGSFALPTKAGLGVELDLGVCKRHPYQPNSFPSLWDSRWLREFTKG